MAIADWVRDMKALAESVFGEPVYFTEPRQISGTSTHSRISPPYTIISGPTDTYDPEEPTIYRRFSVRHVVGRNESAALEAYQSVESLNAAVKARGADVYVGGETALVIESVEPPELEGSDNLFAIEVTLYQELER